MRGFGFSHHRRSFVLIAVLVIMGGALLVVTSLLFTAQADLAGQANAAGEVQSRALAWSGVQAVMSRLNDQRSLILDGELPRVDREYVVYETARRAGVARLLPVGSGEEYLVPEAGKLDLNAVDAAVLSDTGMAEAATAQAIVEHREKTPGRPYQSVAELLGVPAVTPELLYGELEEMRVMGLASGEEADLGARVAERLMDDSPRGLADVVTVYGFEPALQRNGKLRINLNVSWSEELGRRLDERFGEGAGRLVKQIMDSGTEFDDEAKVFQVLRSLDTPVEEWPDIVDAVTTESGEYHFGRLDINSASREALAALPGIDEEQASQMVQARQRLSIDERSTVAWPAIEQIVEPEAYDELAGRITTRCWTYRVRVAAGEVDADDVGDPEAALGKAVIYEAVIDLSAPRPRVAYLRDITLLETTALLASNASLGAVEEEEADVEAEMSGIEGDAPADGAEEEETGLAVDAAGGGSDSDLMGEETWGVGDWEDGGATGTEAEMSGESDASGRAEAGTRGSSSTSTSSQRRRIGRWQSGG